MLIGYAIAKQSACHNLYVFRKTATNVLNNDLVSFILLTL